jgi:MFS family permease
MSDPAPLDYPSPQPLTADGRPGKAAVHIISLIVMIDLIGFGIIIPLLPFYVPDYNAGTVAQTFKVTLLFAVYSICQFIGAPVLGLVSDRFGRRPVLALSQAGSAAGYLLLGLATQKQFGFDPTTILVLVYISRIVDGFTGGNISTAQAYLSDITTPEQRPKAMAALGAAFGVGFVLGPMIGGVLGHFDKSWPAYAAMALAALAGVLTWLRLPESRVHIPVEDEVWLHPSKFAPILRRPVLLQLLAIAFFAMAAFVMMECTSSLFLDAIFGWKQFRVGLFFAFTGVVIVLMQGGVLRRLKKINEWPLAAAGLVLVGVGMFAMTASGYARAATAGGGLVLLLIGGAINATGRSLQQPTVSSLLSKFSGPDEHGMDFGLYHGLLSLARVAGPLVAAPAYTRLNHTGQFVTAGVMAVALGGWTAALKRKAGRPPGQKADEGLAVPPTAGEAHAVRTEPA